MKILKIFGIVVGIHVFALILIFANPGCSSTTKPAPTVADTAPKPADTPKIVVPVTTPAVYSSGAGSPAAVTFNPDAPAAPVAEATPGVRFVPTRPGTPVAGALVTEPVKDVIPATTYVVKPGDNLWTIAKKNNLTVAQLSAANSLPASANLKPGQKLIIPAKMLVAPAAAPAAAAKTAEAPAAHAAASSARSADAVKHTVKSGETLGTIARNYGVRQRDIAVANNISDPAKIRIGMELIIPGWQAPAKSGKTTSKTPAPAEPKTAEPVPAPINVPAEPAPASAPPPVPVIRIDEGPVKSAPKP